MKTKCPFCDYLATNHETLDNDRVTPKEGDVSFCINCGQINIFGEFGGLMKCDIKDLSDEVREEIQKIKKAWLQVKVYKTK